MISAGCNAPGSATLDIHRPVGLGRDVRLDSPVLAGTALFLEDDLVHLCAYPRREG